MLKRKPFETEEPDEWGSKIVAVRSCERSNTYDGLEDTAVHLLYADGGIHFNTTLFKTTKNTCDPTQYRQVSDRERRLYDENLATALTGLGLECGARPPRRRRE